MNIFGTRIKDQFTLYFLKKSCLITNTNFMYVQNHLLEIAGKPESTNGKMAIKRGSRLAAFLTTPSGISSNKDN